MFGDTVLKGFADLLKVSVRATDIVVRSGGEEFVVFCPDTDGSGALTMARKIAAALEQKPLGNGDRRVTITVSIGIASYPETGIFDPMALLNAADQAMYHSKAQGRNHITVFRKEEALAGEAQAPVRKNSDEDFILKMKERLRYVNLKNEEAVLESLRPLTRRANEILGYDPGYTDRIVKDVEGLCLKMALPEAEAVRARRAALLCNLGFLNLPRDVLRKSFLNDQERALVRQHPFFSIDIIGPIAFLAALKEDVLAHHEHFDGSGYPRGLKEGMIPIASRMIAVAEAYEAMVSPRPYRAKPLSRKETASAIAKESSRQFDPSVVACFLKQVK
ncbi:MAG: HD domain-containing phosphohydrolase [Candidatus Omnitrophota bacterium]